MCNGFEVEVEALRKAAFVAGVMADSIVKAVVVQGFGTAVEQALPGSERAAKQSHGLEEDWEEQLRGLAEKARSYQERLESSADIYDRVEESIARSLGRECD